MRDGQRYERVGTVEHTRSDGTVTWLEGWATHCAECSAPMVVLATAKRGPESRRCVKHKRPGAKPRKVREAVA
jgi:hypothetical protein